MEGATEGRARDVSGAHANASRWRSIAAIPIEEPGGAVQEEDPLGNPGEGPEHEVLIFPEGESDAVTIIRSDVESLQPGGLLSGNIIDFYIKYLHKDLPLESQNNFHSFNSFFFTKLMENDGVPTESEQRKAAFERVRKWTGEVNIFEKDYVFIPVNQSSHWSLIIICHLSSLNGSPDKLRGPPCILHLDSVKGKHVKIESHIRSFFIHAWKEECHDPTVDQLLELSQMKYEEVKVPQQNNDYDCGIYLMHYAELFLFQSLMDNFVPNQGSLFTTLWDASEVLSKRTKIRNLILELILVSIRKSQEHEILRSRLSRIQTCPVLQASVEEHACRLVGNGERMEYSKQFDADDRSKHRHHHITDEDFALENQRHTGNSAHLCHRATGEVIHMLDDDHQREQLAQCATLKPTKERSKRRKWSSDETSILLDCKKEGGRFFKENQATTDWNAISQEIGNKIATNPPSGDQARLRYDTLLKAYKKLHLYCLTNCKHFSELSQDELGKLKLATNLTQDWYNVLDDINSRSPQKAGPSSKRMKHTLPDVEAGGPVLMCPHDSPHRSLLIHEACSDSTSEDMDFAVCTESVSRHVAHIPETNLEGLPSPVSKWKVTAEPFMLRGLPDPNTGAGGRGNIPLDDCRLPYTAISIDQDPLPFHSNSIGCQISTLDGHTAVTTLWTSFVVAPPKLQEAEGESFRDGVLESTPTCVKQLIAGGIAGGLSKTAVAPLERIKILYQIRHGKFQSMGVCRSLSCIVTTEGLASLYRGNGASVLRIVPYAAIHFAAYEQYRYWIIDALPAAGTGPVIDLVAGTLAGGTAVMCTYPLDLARTLLAYQVNGLGSTSSCASVLRAPYKGITDVCTRVLVSQEGGVRRLYRGLCPTLWGILPYAGLKFFVYECLKGQLPEDSRSSLLGKLACGVTAGAVGQTLTYPLDVVRRQMQVQSENALVRAQYKGTLDGLISIARGQGWKQLFAGLGINYIKLIPSAAIGFSAYDSLKSILQVPPRGKT